MRFYEKGQGATEYLLMLGAVLVIVAVAVYYVTSTGGYPAVGAVPADYDNTIRINVETGSIATGDWQYSVSQSSGSYSWTDGTEKLDAPYVTIQTGLSAGTYYVSLRHKPSGHIYFSDRTITIG